MSQTTSKATRKAGRGGAKRARKPASRNLSSAAGAVDEWRQKLSDLVAQARSAAAGDDRALRRSLSRKLTDFVEDSPGSLGPDILEMDRIAERAATDLLIQNIDERVDAIAQRSSEFVRLAKEMEARAAQATAAAQSIRLERAHAAVESLTRSVGVLLDLRSTLTSADDVALAGAIDQVLATIKSVRDQVEAHRMAGPG
jgi:hypothetical protein